jgi:hypothetical protein
MDSYYFWVLILAIITYLFITDSSVAVAFYYVLKLAKSNYERQKWWLLNNPRNPVVKYLMWRRSMNLAKELIDEYKNK